MSCLTFGFVFRVYVCVGGMKWFDLAFFLFFILNLLKCLMGEWWIWVSCDWTNIWLPTYLLGRRIRLSFSSFYLP